MRVGILERLTSDVFQTSIGFHLPPPALRRRLQRSAEVRQVVAALWRGEITEVLIRRFASSLVSEFSEGRRLPNGLALAGLAVVLEQWPTDFAVAFLHELAGLQLAELSVSIHVARECWKSHCLLSKNQFRDDPG